jgi:hypothetical protein
MRFAGPEIDAVALANPHFKSAASTRAVLGFLSRAGCHRGRHGDQIAHTVRSTILRARSRRYAANRFEMRRPTFAPVNTVGRDGMIPRTADKRFYITGTFRGPESSSLGRDSCNLPAGGLCWGCWLGFRGAARDHRLLSRGEARHPAASIDACQYLILVQGILCPGRAYFLV